MSETVEQRQCRSRTPDEWRAVTIAEDRRRPGPHCEHWQDGDGDCCKCREPNWCPDSGETAEALAVRGDREKACPGVGGRS